MNSMKLTKKALISSTLALILCFGMLLGTTYAWFTDSVTSSGNVVQSGTLDVQLFQHTETGTTEITDQKEPVFDANILWEPGYTHVVYLSIKNNGTLALKYKVSLEVTHTTIKDLTEVMSYVVTPDAKVGDVTSWAGNGIYLDKPYHETASQNVKLLPGEEHFFALSVHMDEEAGNEFMNQTIEFDVKVLAAQLASEEDAFGPDYDADATYPGGETSSPIVPGEDTTVYVRDNNGAKVAGFYFPAESLDQTANKVSVDVELVNKAADKYDFEITVDGLKENNDTPVRVQLRIPAGLDSSSIQVTHNGNPVTGFTYNALNGYVSFDTTSFSPFSVAFDPNDKIEYPATPENIPVAGLTDVTADWDGSTPEKTVVLSDAGPDVLGAPALQEGQSLEALFQFVAPHDSETVRDCDFKGYECDYYVSIDRDIKAGSIVLGGQYGTYEWIAFSNPMDIAANEIIPLLGSVTKIAWTYEGIAGFVSTFNCGVGEAIDAPTNLAGATFTVRLRLTNPETREFFDVNVVEYTFGVDGGVVITNINDANN